MHETNDHNTSTQYEATVLIVDDCAAVHRLLKARLRAETYKLDSVMNGPDALLRAGMFQPDLILLDLNMPGMDGFEILRHLKDCAETHDIPVVVVSGQNSSEDKVRAFDLGAVDFVSKPFDMTELRARVRVALRMQSLIRMLALKAQIDGLTGLCNRALFDKRWAEEHERASRSGQPLSLAMIDLDEFKTINDHHGHPAGDAVLVGVASMVQNTIRVADIACRFGGEEFAVILPDTTPKHATLLCERIRERCQEMVWNAHPERRVTLSIGIAGTAHASVLGPGDWLHKADEQLYNAKRGGRNRVETLDLGSGPLRVAS